ncbi:triose-phosphate isomerase [Falseniella ignava]|uniref:Triosephosphate isomerase n=1 Tax=Falseniella ignava CCUG 37419 TaxID=883112 RepID=K1LB81_9LACT|nr:triose-phosphate isomerase [Falseniella ignava]EKB53770.1 triose-phosphate isomerase [Falseniella ignava CCUG 37419]
MSRKPIIAGNWKMNKSLEEAVEFVKEVQDKLPDASVVESVIGAPALFLPTMIQTRTNDQLVIAAQNCYTEDAGAFTGEISPKLLAEVGVQYVIIGHSERREYFNESNQFINEKAKAIFRNGMLPIICCGESLEQRESGETEPWIKEQITEALAGLNADQVKQLVIAYEPIWAIGTGKSSSAELANETCGFIRSVVEELYSQDVANAVRIQYGGSVKPDNIAQYLAEEHIDGALVGGASLEPTSFIQLLEVTC